MTCIVGVIDKGDVWMGGDSAATDGWSVRIIAHPKIFHIRDMLVGVSGSFRMAQLLQYHLPETLEEWDGETPFFEYLVRVFVPEIRNLFNGAGYGRSENNEESHTGDFMIGHNGRLYTVFTDYQVNEWVDGFTAVGCGQDYALGALYATPQAKAPADKLVEMALEAATYFSNGVERPFHIECLRKAR